MDERLGIIQLPYGTLKGLLRLPDDVEIKAIREDIDRPHLISILVESPQLKQVERHSVVPWVKCTVHTEFCTADEVVHIGRATVENY